MTEDTSAGDRNNLGSKARHFGLQDSCKSTRVYSIRGAIQTAEGMKGLACINQPCYVMPGLWPSWVR